MGLKFGRLLTALCALAIVSAACSQSSSQASKVTLTFWHGYNTEETKVFNDKVVAAFEQSHPNITIQTQAVPYDPFHKKLLTAIARGPDPRPYRPDITRGPE